VFRRIRRPQFPFGTRRWVTLILSRRFGEKIIIADGTITVQVLDRDGDRVRVGVTAPPDVPIQRAELLGQGGHPKHPKAKPEAPPCPSSGT
jgi:carbon storage regulator